MAKELPFFKFEPSEWDNGNIQMCSRESKGLFIDICSVYWSRLGELPYALALQKHCNGDESALQELVKHEIIIVENGQIIIEFLDEQLSEFNETSEKRRKAANKRWNDASALQVQSKSNAIREEKKRGEERKIPAQDYFESKANAFEEIRDNELEIESCVRTLYGRGWMAVKAIDVIACLKIFINSKADITTPKANVRQHFKNWLIREEIKNLITFSEVAKKNLENGRPQRQSA